MSCWAHESLLFHSSFDKEDTGDCNIIRVHKAEQWEMLSICSVLNLLHHALYIDGCMQHQKVDFGIECMVLYWGVNPATISCGCLGWCRIQLKLVGKQNLWHQICIWSPNWSEVVGYFDCIINMSDAMVARREGWLRWHDFSPFRAFFFGIMKW